MGRNAPVQDAVSAGGVVWRRAPGGAVEVVMCGRSAEGLWVLPKGTPDAGESLLETAVREVEEETGLRVSVGEKVGSINYWFVSGGVRVHKYVHHWLMEPTGGDVADHDHEFDVVAWLPIDEAERVATYANERRVIADAARMLGAAG